MQSPTTRRVQIEQEIGLDFQKRRLQRDLTRIQRDIVCASKQYRHIAVKGCHGSGKTHVSSGIAIEHITGHTDGTAYVIAPTLRQVKNFISQIEIARQEIDFFTPECSSTGLKLSEGNYILGASSSKGVNIQGFHGPRVLIVCDEAPGIDQQIWDAIRGISSGGKITVLELGNPVVPSGHFFDNFGKNSETCHGITISAFDTPNLYNRAARRPYTIEEILGMSDAELDGGPHESLVSRRWVKECYYDWGPDSPNYYSRVLGLFPTQSEWSVFSLEWIHGANRDPKLTELDTAEGHYIQVGIDVAGGGDDETVLCARVDGIIIAKFVYKERHPAGRIISDLHWIKDKFGDRYQMGPVVIDIVGIGLNVAPVIAEAGFYVIGFQANARPRNTRDFYDAKSEIYWEARGFFEDGDISQLDPDGDEHTAPYDDTTRAQLSTIMWATTNRGKIRIEPKEQAKKRGVKSPDRAEALIMAFMRIVPGEQVIQYGEHAHISMY